MTTDNKHWVCKNVIKVGWQKNKKVVDNRKDTWYHIRVVTGRKLNNKK